MEGVFGLLQKIGRQLHGSVVPMAAGIRRFREGGLNVERNKSGRILVVVVVIIVVFVVVVCCYSSFTAPLAFQEKHFV